MRPSSTRAGRAPRRALSAAVGLALLLLTPLTACESGPAASAATRADAVVRPDMDAGPVERPETGPADATTDVFLAPNDLSVIGDYGPLPDLPPLPADEGALPDAAPPRTDGPPHLRWTPSAVSLREAREPAALRLSLEGEPPAGPVVVTLTAPDGLHLEPASLTLDAEHRAGVTYLSADVDADDADTFGRLTAEAAGLAAATVPFVVYDAHVTWEMLLDPAELDFVRSSNDKTRRLTVENLMNGRAVAPAEINLRGKGTLVCPRRSFTVRFQSPVRLQNSPPLEDVVLIALCEDPLVMRSRVSLELLARLDLFPAWFSYLELRYGGETRGVYLLIERPKSAIAREFPENTQVLRRLSDAEVEIDRPDEAEIVDREAFLASYLSLYGLREALQDELLLSELQRRMLYDQYLMLLAYNSAMENGDNIDEVYFYDRSAPPNRPEAATPFYAVMAWDQDEIFRNCHTPAPLAEPLTNCSESGLDRLIVRHPSIRALYITQLRRLLDGPVSADSVDHVVTRAAAELAVYLARPGVQALHTPPDQPPPDAAVSRQTLLDLMARRRETLRALLDPPAMP
jgi:hypothetical protein